MKILHICSGFSDQRIYNQLISSLSLLGIEQIVYIPARAKNQVGKNRNESLTNVKYVYSLILKPVHRIFFRIKIRTVYKDLTKNIDGATISKVHAHFLFSDGAVALKLKRSRGIPYIVAVRNTDINIFYKYMVHLRKVGTEILNEAERIIFITPSYRSLLLEKYIPKRMHERLIKKMVIIPNGVEPFWLNNPPQKINRRDDSLRILYVGDFSRNKNLLLLMNCIERLNKEGFDCNLTLVGGGRNSEEKVIKKVTRQSPKYFKIVNHINNREGLRKIYDKHDIFVMISLKETFGVVYVEAMSQGLPIIYTRGQGIDGYFVEGSVGYSTDPKNIEEINSKIRKVKENLNRMSNEVISDSRKFNWTRISNQYLEVYSTEN